MNNTAMLTWKDFITNFVRLGHLSHCIVFHRKLLFMCGGIFVYYGVLYALAIFKPGEGFSIQQALHVLVEIPGSVLGIYLTMDLVAGERDRNTLEILFSTSASHYSIWGFRMLSVYIILGLSMISMSTISFFLFAEFPFIRGAVNAFLPAVLMANLTFYFSVLFRSSNAAGMLSLGILIIVFISAETIRNTPYFLFLNPFDAPLGISSLIWNEQALINRCGVATIGLLLIFFALRRMEIRERLLS